MAKCCLENSRLTSIKTEIENEIFTATGKVVIDAGWRRVLSAGHTDKEVVLPCVDVNDRIDCRRVSIKESKTKAPSHFTEGTLIQAMQNIHKYITDSAHRKTLLDGDGIGTSATRSTIIKEPKRRNYVSTKGKYLISTELSRSMIDAYPDLVKSAELTAVNERHLKSIEQTAEGYDKFMRQQEHFICQQVSVVNECKLSVGNAESKSPGKKQTKGKKGQNFRCAECNSDLIRRPAKTKGKYWWGCSSFPRCKKSYREISGKPHIT